ncbi:MAG: hypothetical protein AAFV78_04450, partial [Bacteroidota bacterium]
AGLDGLLIQKNSPTQVYDTLNPELSLMPSGEISALGFRYMTHMGHLFSVPHQSTLIRFDSATSQIDTIWIERYDLYGRILEEVNWNIPFGKFHKNLLPSYWISASSDHRGEWRHAKNEDGELTSRHYYVNNIYKKRGKFFYDDKRKLEKIKVQSQAPSTSNTHFAYVGTFVYDSIDRRISEMHIQKWESLPSTQRYLGERDFYDWEVHMSYREDGEMQEVFFLKKVNGQRYPQYKLTYTYYDEENIRAHLRSLNAFPHFR